MSAQEFWDEDPDLMWAYQKSYIDQKKIEKETMNFNSWLQGMYIYDGFLKLSIIHLEEKKECQLRIIQTNHMI